MSNWKVLDIGIVIVSPELIPLKGAHQWFELNGEDGGFRCEPDNSLKVICPKEIEKDVERLVRATTKSVRALSAKYDIRDVAELNCAFADALYRCVSRLWWPPEPVKESERKATQESAKSQEADRQQSVAAADKAE